MEPLRIGSEEHKQLFCRTFVETHDPFKPEEIVWPDLDAESLARLKSLPVWNEAARTEAATAVKVQALGRTEPDPRPRRGDRPAGLRGGAARRRDPAADARTTASRSSPSPSPRSRRTRPGRSCGPDTASASTRSSRSASSRSAAARASSRQARRGLRDDHAGGGAPHPLHRELGGVPARPASAALAAGLRRAARLEHRGAGRRPRQRRDADERGGERRELRRTASR